MPQTTPEFRIQSKHSANVFWVGSTNLLGVEFVEMWFQWCHWTCMMFEMLNQHHLSTCFLKNPRFCQLQPQFSYSDFSGVPHPTLPTFEYSAAGTCTTRWVHKLHDWNIPLFDQQMGKMGKCIWVWQVFCICLNCGRASGMKMGAWKKHEIAWNPRNLL